MQPGTTIGRFEIERPLGQGGMAMVYKVRHRQLDTVHALKLLKISHPNMARRLLQEGRIQARLRHPNVVGVVDVVEHEGAIGLLMEYVQGSSLEDCLGEGPMNPEEALEVFRQVLAGVGAAHAAGVTHRDLKPANILLTAQGDHLIAKVTDFGIAKVLSEDELAHRTRAGVAMGTPGYMAPEQITDSSAVDHRADIFALGAILYEMLAGMPVFRGPDALVTMNRTTAGTYMPLAECVPRLPRHVAGAVDRALSTDRRSRFEDCAAMARALYGSDDFVRQPAPDPTTARPGAVTPSGGAPTLAPTDTGLDLGGAGALSSETLSAAGEGSDDGPTADTLSEEGPAASVLAQAWGLRGKSEADRRREVRQAAGTGGDEEEEIGAAPEADREGINGRDAADMMGDLFWTMVRATLWGMGKTIQYGGVPIALLFGVAWLVSYQAATDLEQVTLLRKSQAAALHKALDEGLVVVPDLVAAGANPALLAALQRQYEEAPTAEARVEAARELSSVMTQQLAVLPPPSTEEEVERRRALEATLVKLDREAARYGDLDRRHGQLQDSVGGKLATVMNMAPTS